MKQSLLLLSVLLFTLSSAFAQTDNSSFLGDDEKPKKNKKEKPE